MFLILFSVLFLPVCFRGIWPFAPRPSGLPSFYPSGLSTDFPDVQPFAPMCVRLVRLFRPSPFPLISAFPFISSVRLISSFPLVLLFCPFVSAPRLGSSSWPLRMILGGWGGEWRTFQHKYRKKKSKTNHCDEKTAVFAYFCPSKKA